MAKESVWIDLFFSSSRFLDTLQVLEDVAVAAAEVDVAEASDEVTTARPAAETA